MDDDGDEEVALFLVEGCCFCPLLRTGTDRIPLIDLVDGPACRAGCVKVAAAVLDDDFVFVVE